MVWRKRVKGGAHEGLLVLLFWLLSKKYFTAKRAMVGSWFGDTFPFSCLTVPPGSLS